MEWLKKNNFNIIIFCVFLIGIFFRLKGYLVNQSLWHDEATLAASIYNRHFYEMFQPLLHNQCAPLLFMLSTKFVTLFFGVGEWALRLIPFVGGCISIFVFYKLTENTLINQLTRILALILFILNFQLIKYCGEFKQYSTDVLVYICAILYFVNLSFENINKRKICQYAVMSIVFVLSAFPAIFVLAGKILQLVMTLNKKTLKNIFLYLLMLGAVSSLYYYLILYQNQSVQSTLHSDYWNSGFISFNLGLLRKIIEDNLGYFFDFGNDNLLLALLMIILGAILFVKNKNKYIQLCLLSIVFMCLASMGHIYPIYQRTALSLIPILLIFICKPLDFALEKRQKILAIVVLALLMFCFKQYDKKYLTELYQNKYIKMEYGRELMNIMQEKIHSYDYIVVGDASDSEFFYYSFLFKDKWRSHFKTLVMGYDRTQLSGFLNSLKKGYCWIYMPYDFYDDSIIPFVLSWARHHKIIYEYKKSEGLLLYVRIE